VEEEEEVISDQNAVISGREDFLPPRRWPREEAELIWLEERQGSATWMANCLVENG
jgi:hypothetical protein